MMEIIIASLIIIFVTIAITQAISSSVKGEDRSFVEIAGVSLSQEMTEIVRAIANEDWHNITNLATSSANKYYATTTNSRWVATSTVSGENATFNNITYTRYFYIDEIYRASSTGAIAASSSVGSYLDPSTSKVVTYVGWTNLAGESDNFSQVIYLARISNETYYQTDWRGGGVGEQVIPYTDATSTFATSTSVDFTATGTIQLSEQVSLPTDYVAYWKFDEGSGTAVDDTSSYGNDGTLSASTGWVSGKVGNAVNFDSVLFNATSSASLQTNTDMTISFVMKNLKNPTGCVCKSKTFYKGSTGDIFHEYRLEIDSGDSEGGYGAPSSKWVLWGNSWTGAIYESWLTPGGGTGLQWGDWHLVTVVKSSGGGLYEDRGTLLYSGTGITSVTSTQSIKIGNYGFGTSTIIDEMRIYNRALSVSEIQSIYDSIFQ
ncbi:hypothetical protein HY967_05135 [Candidatus Jorgensenbacteria bacterium]|nr:hypothetical protein [Candidatus Jorgensenbacteria bacterium]